MDRQTDKSWNYLIAGLLFTIVLSLFSIEEALKAQRTPEQVTALELEKKRAAQTVQHLAAYREKKNTEWKNKEWGELATPEDYISKASAHGYHLWVFCLMIIVAGPLIMRKINDRDY